MGNPYYFLLFQRRKGAGEEKRCRRDYLLSILCGANTII